MPFLTMPFLVALALAVPVLTGPARADAPRSAFDAVFSVFTSPRCLNCHQSGARPLQTDAGRTHQMNIQRGSAGRGVPAMPCASCHVSRNVGRVPGAPDWHMPPPSMGWTGLSAADICRAVLDPARNGGRDLAALAAHLREDALVRWTFAPGPALAPAPGSHAAFVADFERWIAAGAPCS